MAKEKRLTKRNKSIRHLMNNDERLKFLIGEIGDINYITHEEDPYGFLIHEIIEQMLSVKAAKKIHERLMLLCEDDINPEKILLMDEIKLKSIGTSIQKVRYIKQLTEAVVNNRIDLFSLQKFSDEEVMRALTAIPGIGNWTAKMFLIFVLDRPDVLPFEDGAFKQSFKWLYETEDTTKENITRTCMSWSPYSSVASRYLYRALDSGLAKKQIF